jgi:hypothetical protein
VVENIFGITASVFRVLQKLMLLQPEKIELIVIIIAHLHNFLRKVAHSAGVYTPPGTMDYEVDGKLVEENWRDMGKGNMTTLLPVINMPRKRTSNAK